MVFKTNWGPTSVADRLEGIVKSHDLPNNVHQRVEVTQERDGGYTIHGKSTSSIHNTGVFIKIEPERNGRGTVVTVDGDHKTPSGEAREVENELRRQFFK